MSQYNKTKGSQFETDVMKWLRKAGVIAERLTKAGAKDEGDIVTVIAGETYILELKNRATLSLPQFWREAQVEALNYAKARTKLLTRERALQQREKDLVEDAAELVSMAGRLLFHKSSLRPEAARDAENIKKQAMITKDRSR